MTCESTHLDAIALRLQHGYLHTTSYYVADFDDKASLSNKSEQKLSCTLQLANYTRPLFEIPYAFAAEVIPYQEQWKRVTVIEN